MTAGGSVRPGFPGGGGGPFMSGELASIFREEDDLDRFRLAVLPLDGKFDLGAEAMIELGTSYLEKHPDRAFDRDMDEVRFGYALTRFCLLEKAMSGFEPEVKGSFRAVFAEPGSAGELLKEAVAGHGAEKFAARFKALSDSLTVLKGTVDELPKGLVKERFLGGISGLFNVVYLIGIFLPRLAPGCLQGS